MKKIFIQTLSFTLGLLLFVGISIIYAWTEPTQAPPSGNVAAPLNVSSVSQYKSGALGVGGVFHGYSTGIFDGNVGIGTTTPTYKLQVVGGGTVTGNLRASQFIDNDNSAYFLNPSASGIAGVFNGNVGIGTTGPSYKLSVVGQGNFSRDAAGECCSGGDFTLSLAENTISTNKKATIQFHNSGQIEGYLKLNNGPNGRELLAGSYQDNMDLGATGVVRGDGGLCIGGDCRTAWPSGGGAKQIQHYVGHRDYSGCNYTSPGAPQFYWDPALYPGLTTFLMNFAVLGTNQGWAYVTMYDVTANAPAPGTETGPYGSDQLNVFVTINPANLVTGHWYGISAKVPSNCSAGFGGYSDSQFILRVQ